MKAHLLSVVLLGLLLSSCSLTESDPEDEGEMASYLPLQVGNAWIYTTDPDPSVSDTLRVLEGVTVGGTEYALLGGMMYGGPITPDTLRTDEEGRIWRYSYGEDAVWLDPTQDDGATYTYTYQESRGPNDYRVYVTRRARVETPAGVFENGRQFLFDDPGLADEEFGYVLAPGVGIIELGRSWHRMRTLQSYEVGGR